MSYRFVSATGQDVGPPRALGNQAVSRGIRCVFRSSRATSALPLGARFPRLARPATCRQVKRVSSSRANSYGGDDEACESSLLLISAFGLHARVCGKKSEAGAGPALRSDRPADQPKALRDYTTHLDLWEHAHLAEIDHHGLYIEFGTAGRRSTPMAIGARAGAKDGVANADRFTLRQRRRRAACTSAPRRASR